MPMQGNTDTQTAKVKFPKERTQRGLTVLLANALTSTCTTISFASGAVTAANIKTGMVVSGNNVAVVGVNTSNGDAGFDVIGPTVTTVNPSNVIISTATAGYMVANQQVFFSNTITFKPNTLSNTYNANTYLVTKTRASNANSIAANAVVHIGWNYVTVGTGFVRGLTIVNPGRGVGPANATGYLTFTANTQYPGGSNANGTYTLNANGSVVSVSLNANGSGYVLTPTANANNGNAVISVQMGGRANRIQVECLSVANNPVALSANTGGIWFPGQ